MTAERGGTRVLVTGAGGFVGPHLVDALRRIGGDDVELIATAKDAELHRSVGRLAALDVATRRRSARRSRAGADPCRQSRRLRRAGGRRRRARRGLGGPSSRRPQPRARHPRPCAGLLAVPGQLGPRLRRVGAIRRAGRRADDAGAARRIFGDQGGGRSALGALVPAGLECVRFRPFNHTGRGQSEDFVIPAFAMQVARIEADLAPPILKVGNLDASATFSMSPTSSTLTHGALRGRRSSRAKSSTSPPAAPAASATC